jgi:hypothetical protein
MFFISPQRSRTPQSNERDDELECSFSLDIDHFLVTGFRESDRLDDVFGLHANYGLRADAWLPSMGLLGTMARTVSDLAILSVQAGEALTGKEFEALNARDHGARTSPESIARLRTYALATTAAGRAFVLSRIERW